ncbi:Receptor-type tyrosine-protein phosphatase delta, partial [Fasciola gigantica]
NVFYLFIFFRFSSPSLPLSLEFGRVYQFEVAAYNGVDLGLPAQLNVSTPEEIPDNFPVQVRLNGLSATAIEVTWSPPLQQQWPGEILSYQVRYFQPNSPNTTEVITNTAEPRLRIQNLKERTFYTVMVRAITANGPGPWSMSSTIRTTAELPEPPSQITGVRINQRQIKVTWSTMPAGPKPVLPGQSQPPAAMTVPITGFRIYYSKNDNPQDLSTWQIVDVGPVTMATLDSLDPAAEYVIKIKSRGADRRYGRLSDPVVVGVHVPDDGLSGGPNGHSGLEDRAVNEKRSIRHLSCHWIPALDNARLGEASLKLNWQRPAQVDGLYQFQIQLLGSKSYTDESNQPHRVHFEPRTLEVSSAMLDSSLAPVSPGDFQLGSLSHPSVTESYPQYSLVIDELEANTVYDVHIRPVYNGPTMGHMNEANSPTGRTSCRTLMLPPSNVPRPVPVAVKPQTGQVVIRVFRVSESLGRIRRYYLILSKSNAIPVGDGSSAVQQTYWQSKLRDASHLWNPDAFIAAEYSQEVFVEPHLEILLSSPNYNRHRRHALDSSRVHLTGITNNRLHNQSEMQSDVPVSPAPDVLVYGRQLIKDQEYKAFVLACIYQNSEPTNTKYPKSYNSGLLDQTVSPKMDEDAPTANLCTSSVWSLPFSPNKPVAYPDVDTTGGIGVAVTATEPSVRSQVDQAGGGTGTTGADMFTVSLIAVIVGLGIIAIVCIAVGCVMRRRRPKQLRNDMSITLVNSDNTLKTPLMNPKLSTFSETNGKVDGSPTRYQTPEPVPNVACVTVHILFPQCPYTHVHPLNPSAITGSVPPTPTKVRTAVTASHLPEHVAMLKTNGGVEMAEEYESLETGVGLTWKHANLEVNRPKNRYANVVAYDHSRVLLSQIDDVGPLPETFYDFWRMVWEQNSYVIVMMTRLEERARVKCDQYWPTRGVDTYTSPYHSKINSGAKFKVSLKDTAEFAYYTLRTFHLERHDDETSIDLVPSRMNSRTDLASIGRGGGSRGAAGGGVVSREIKQFQFTAWPDYGTPDHAQPLLLFIRRVTQVRAHILHQLQQERLVNGDSVGTARGTGVDLLRTNSPQPTSEIGPTIVHCSAGVGRTGAFIVIDSQLERLKHEKSVDIYGSVSRMRNQRNFMVQTEEQYTFLYDVFVEAATVNGTEVTAHGLYNHVVKLRQTTPANLIAANKSMGNGLQDQITRGKLPLTSVQSGLEMEFNRLDMNLYNKKQFTSAILPENRMKNRSNDILPYESSRVCLPLIRGLDGSDYINASFVDGYRKKRAYIATQTPLPNTVDDFWRLVWEHYSPIIVMLNEAVEHLPSGNVQHDVYWPMERSTRYQHLLVEPMVEYNMPHFILREFRLTDTRDGQSRTLRQFQLHGWSNDQVVPKSAEAMIDLIGQVHKTQAQFGQDGPITVHCNTGSGRTAVFISLSLLLERMRCEGMVDVFLTTRMLRTQRAHMIQTADQYAFCYAATLEYLASFDHYTS